MYNEMMLAKSKLGVALGIELDYTYEDLRFIPLCPTLEISIVLAWKKEQVFTSATRTFLAFARQYNK